jgi:hypothetical protein
LTLAKELREVPNTTTSRPTKFDSLIDETLGDQQHALRTWAASYAVAARLTFSLYSDDRYIRAQARREGIPSFGTVSLLEALVERGRLDPAGYKAARRRLRASGALGIPPGEDELVEEAREADWQLTESLRQGLLDPSSWRDANAGVRRHVGLLRAAYEDDPTQFEPWVLRVLDAAQLAHPGHTLGRHASILLASAWSSESPAFVQALIRALETVARTLGRIGDPVSEAFDLLLSFGIGKPDPFRAALFGHVIVKLDARDQARMLQRVGFTT